MYTLLYNMLIYFNIYIKDHFECVIPHEGSICAINTCLMFEFLIYKKIYKMPAVCGCKSSVVPLFSIWYIKPRLCFLCVCWKIASQAMCLYLPGSPETRYPRHTSSFCPNSTTIKKKNHCVILPVGIP